MIKHYVEFTYPGTFISETTTDEIVSRNQKITLPKGAYAYRIFDREEVTSKGEELVGKPKNYGPRHIRGELFDVGRVQREVPDNRILLANMECNGWPLVVKCRQGFLPAETDDVMIAD